jgi:large subunit ribosomal protein L1
MGKKRTILVDLSQEEPSSAKATEGRQPKKPRPEKKSKKATAEPAQAVQAMEEVGEEMAQPEAPTKPKEPRIRSKRFKALRQQIDPQKHYPLDEAVDLLLQLANAGFDESVELNLTAKKEGVSGSVKLPHGTGKEKRIVIWDTQTEEKVKKGQLDFDLLIAKPQDMATIARYGKTLGPKGLMPNPKTGTVSEDPEKAAARLKQELHFKTEKKAPLIHTTIGKVSLGKQKLVANVQAFLEALGPKQVVRASISSSMGPGIKLQVE